MKVALVYDRINKWGGAESVLLTLHEIFPDAPLYTSVYDKKLAPWADVFDVYTSFLQNFPLPKNKHEYYPFLMGIAFESFNFDEYDLVISVTSEFAKAIITRPSTLHICYCLTPTSYLWSGYEQYFSNRSNTYKSLSSLVIKYLRLYDKIISRRPDKYIAISKTVQGRIKKYYSLPSEVIYPPVAQGEALHMASQQYFLIVSRLVPNKRIDLAIQAFNKLGLQLKIVGTGRQENMLKTMAKNNIEFLGSLTDSRLARYYKDCFAVVVVAEEDFGIVPVEAQSYGKPVIAFRAGGATETIRPGRTGWFFEKQTVQSLVEKILEVEKKITKIKSMDCINAAKKFSKDNFKKGFKLEIDRLFKESF